MTSYEGSLFEIVPDQLSVGVLGFAHYLQCECNPIGPRKPPNNCYLGKDLRRHSIVLFPIQYSLKDSEQPSPCRRTRLSRHQKEQTGWYNWRQGKSPQSRSR